MDKIWDRKNLTKVKRLKKYKKYKKWLSEPKQNNEYYGFQSYHSIELKFNYQTTVKMKTQWY